MSDDKTSATSAARLKTAKLFLKLEADSGFESEQEHCITVEQWGRIQTILDEPRAK